MGHNIHSLLAFQKLPGLAYERGPAVGSPGRIPERNVSHRTGLVNGRCPGRNRGSGASITNSIRSISDSLLSVKRTKITDSRM